VVCFLVYAVGDEKELIMVGSTGTIQNDGSLKIKNGGLKEKIVEGNQFAKDGKKIFLVSTNAKEI
jgi:PDZ domain-containing secreted protein